MNAATQSPTPQPPSTPGSLGIGSARAPMRVDLDQLPFVVAWEITRACVLACRHCPAEAQPRRLADAIEQHCDTEFIYALLEAK